jgi:hypothetical protein
MHISSGVEAVIAIAVVGVLDDVFVDHGSVDGNSVLIECCEVSTGGFMGDLSVNSGVTVDSRRFSY